MSYETIDQYIEVQPEPIQLILQKIRDVIKSVAPDADERSLRHSSHQLGQGWQAGYPDHVCRTREASDFTHIRPQWRILRTSCSMRISVPKARFSSAQQTDTVCVDRPNGAVPSR